MLQCAGVVRYCHEAGNGSERTGFDVYPHVCFWPLADMSECAANVRFEG
jgi:hypothetical protein